MTKEAVEKGGTRDYIKKDGKNGTVGKRSINDRQKVVKQIRVTADTDYLITSLALIYNITQGELIDEIVRVTATAYNLAVDLSQQRPVLTDFSEVLIFKT